MVMKVKNEYKLRIRRTPMSSTIFRINTFIVGLETIYTEVELGE